MRTSCPEASSPADRPTHGSRDGLARRQTDPSQGRTASRRSGSRSTARRTGTLGAVLVGVLREEDAQRSAVKDSRRLQDCDTTVLFEVVVTPIVRIGGAAQLLGGESESRRMCRVRVGLHDVPCKDAEEDAVARPGTQPPQETDRALRRGVWKGARGVFADGAGSFAVYA